MYKTITILLLTLLLISSLPSFGEETKVYVNNKQLSISTVDYQGITYAPNSKALASAFGVSLKWDSSNQTFYVNGKATSIKPLDIGGLPHISVEALANVMGATVEYDGKTNAIRITTSKTIAITTPSPKPPTPNPTPVKTPIPLPTVVVQTPSPTRVPTVTITNPPTQNPTKAPTLSGIFIPKTRSNNTFTVTVTNMEFQSIIKNYYTPKSGYRFCILNVSQQNISAEVQIYTGTFSLFDTDGHSYDYLEGLSNFWLQVLQPGGNNFGHLVYEVPIDAVPEKLVLYSVNTPTLSIELK